MAGRQIPIRVMPGGGASPTGRRQDPLTAFTFAVEIDGLTETFFKSVSGLKAETEVQDHPEGGFNAGMRRLIGRTKWPNLVLKQGFCGPPYSLWKMKEKMLSRETTRFSGTIWQLGPDLVRVCGWKFWEGFVCKWDGPEFDAGKNDLAIESIEIAHEGLTLITQG